MIRVGFIDKAFAVIAHRDKSRLGTFNEMWKRQLYSAGQRHAGDRCPRHGVLKRVVKLPAHGFAKTNAIALIARRRGGEVTVALRRVRHLFG